ncbi:MAG: rhodanese-like domain-containing protein [Desulfobacterales bacterium]
MKTRKLLALAAIFSLLGFWIAGCASSRQGSSPESAAVEDNWKFHDIVDAQFVAQYAKVPMDGDVMIIDSRTFKPMFVKGHVPMAMSIPDSQFDKSAHMLPADKDALLIFYCGGLDCKLSHKSAYKAEALGYRNVKVFAEGFPGWMEVPGNYAAVSVEWLQQQIEADADMVLVDSRPRRPMYEKGHIPGAVSIPDTQFDQFRDKLPTDKEKLLVFYCGGLDCKLSHKSASKAIDLGYRNVRVFAAGYPAWQAHNGDSASGATAAITAGKEEGSIEIAAFREIIEKRPESIYLVDVRDADEFAKGSFRTAVNIPVDTLEGKIKTLPSNLPLVFVCSTGARSGESYYMVKDLRPELKEVYYLEAQVAFKKNGGYEITPPKI